ncbi:MAG: phosphoribosylformylglycinamidine synthase subunit PurS, partial [Candidatus Omnitrophota bacterium]|nr:phosphoribosylformylglycinamidine synthase subunit PurS [Candidatus Omnitrophota bacterium]
MTTASATGSIWRFAVRLRKDLRDAEAEGLKADALDLGVRGVERISVSRVYYLRGDLQLSEPNKIASELLTDPIAEECDIREVNPQSESRGSRSKGTHTIEVAYRPGVRDPVEDSVLKGAADLGIEGIRAVHTAKEYGIDGTLNAEALTRLTDKLLVNATIQQVVTP